MANNKQKKIDHLVVDSGGFIKNSPINDLGENIYSILDVVHEVRDKATKERLQVLPYKLIFREPSTEAIKIINDFAKKTGDYANLSATDIRVLALTYMLEKEHVGIDHLNTEPKKNMVILPTENREDSTNIVGFYFPKSENISSNETNTDARLNLASHEEITSKIDQALRLTKEDGTASNDDEEDGVHDDNDVEDDEEDEVHNGSDGWIKPSNIKHVKKQMGLCDDERLHINVACITSDFSMQNVLKQIGLNVLGVDGMLIKNVRTYLLRCYSCHKVTPKMTAKFCPHCGYQTLKRVAVSVSEDGDMKVHVNFKRPLSSRGTRYSLPMPKGGKHATDPMLFEDQRLPQQRLTKLGQKQTNVFDPAYEAGDSPFAIKDVNSRAVLRGVHLQKMRGRTNPNSNKKGRRKK